MSLGLHILSAQVVVFLAYVFVVWNRFGILTSISSSSYTWEGNKRYIFTAWLYVLGILNLFHFQVIGLFAGLMAIGFATAGITIDHKKAKDLEDEFHTIGTVIAIFAGFLSQFIFFGIWVPAIVFIGITLALLLKGVNWIWWTEVTAMLTISWGFLEIYLT